MCNSDASFDAHERLARDMLAVEAGDASDVQEAMRKIIASAPDTTDVAFLLSLAIAQAGDQAPSDESAPLHPSRKTGLSLRWQRLRPLPPNHEELPSRWWVAGAVPFLGVAAFFWWWGQVGLQTSDQGSGAARAPAMAMFVICVGSLGIALVGVETLFLMRWQARKPVPLPVRQVCSPGWYVDPWGQGSLRWWNGFNWTGRVR